MFARLWVAFAALTLLGCSTVEQKTFKGPLYNYRADMKIHVDGKWFDGMAATKADFPKDITVVSPVALDRIHVTSCARQDVCEFGRECEGFTVSKGGWFGGDAGNNFVYRYVPTKLENEGMCPLYIEAYSKESLTSWGLIAFRAEEKLPAHIDCNGKGFTYAGFTVCQTKSGLQQRMEFKKNVIYEAEESCNIRPVSKNTFDFSPALGFCRATFTDGIDWHRLILVGYEGVLVRVK